MNKIMTLRTNAIIDDLRRMTADDLIRLIDAANYELALMLDEERAKQDYDDLLAELRERELEEQWKQDFDDLLAQQYDAAFETCNYALEGIQ